MGIMDQPVNQFSLNEVLANNHWDVPNGEARIPDSFRLHVHVGGQLAQPETAPGNHLHFPFQSGPPDGPNQRLQNILGTLDGTGIPPDIDEDTAHQKIIVSDLQTEANGNGRGEN